MTTLLNRLAKTWGDTTRDVVLIVASILIAFGLDAWWDGLGERQAQSEQISILLSEFETARNTLTSLSAAIQGASKATNELLTLMGPEATVPESERVFTLIEFSLNFGGATPNQTALESVLATGNPRITESESLIGLLARWPALMEGIEDDLTLLDRNRDIDLQAAFVDIGIGGIAATPAVRNLGLPPPSFPVDIARMLRSVKVNAALSYRALRLRVLSLNVEAAIERVDLIFEELDRASD